MKKIIYRLLTIFLTIELSFILHSILEFFYIKITLNKGEVLANTVFLGKLYCVLPWWLSYGLLTFGMVGGYFLGQVWWRIVYIEKRHWRMRV